MTKAREPAPTVACIDAYCAYYQSVFPNVRQFEQFTRLELGLVAETKRKSLPRLAQTTKADPQAFHHFLAQADWSVEAVRAVRLALTRQALRERPFLLCIPHFAVLHRPISEYRKAYEGGGTERRT